ncbi:Mth938-like domain-containing protein [Thermodesulforhabdus norvegica]|uniref:Mth938-like domain-containing protein n=1 Tax=Thermodesulforhabdus norvegica TaxID=39841 RepID=A0A1I4V1D7_9BACT|nr:MTH938/NDUFAF3 family protein [Thermodesulforhabdus norvegica]SFM94810.1 hypothetical protein SAMN05660836_02079 [Thermodesulforhabdus norvegica]
MIEDYGFGHMVINGRKYTADLKIISDRVISDWWRREGHRLHIDDITDIIDARPEVVVLGTGAFGFMKVPSEVVDFLEARGIEVVVEKTKEAVKRFNGLKEAGRLVAGAFHLTC